VWPGGLEAANTAHVHWGLSNACYAGVVFKVVVVVVVGLAIAVVVVVAMEMAVWLWYVACGAAVLWGEGRDQVFCV